ncbi:MAG: lasso peptide biosynthesis PqqD family chaperone [Clostridia bacterium]|nr:lasso peptide biosynthesis PqqD family chaperone [Clostridia bacterium]
MYRNITKETVIGRKTNLPFVEMDGEVGMLNVDNGKYYSLENVAARIWELIATEKSINDIVSILLEEYEIDKDNCFTQVISFAESLKNEGLIDVKG